MIDVALFSRHDKIISHRGLALHEFGIDYVVDCCYELLFDMAISTKEFMLAPEGRTFYFVVTELGIERERISAIQFMFAFSRSERVWISDLVLCAAKEMALALLMR